MILPKRRNSSLINAYVQARHEIENDAQVNALQNIEDKIKQRRTKIAATHSQEKLLANSNVAAKSEKRIERIKHMDEHRISLEELFLRLQTNPDQGLSSATATTRNKELGDNILAEKNKVPWYVKLIKEFCSTFAILLWVASILSFVTYALTPTDPSNLYLGILLAAIIILSGLGSFYQSFKSAAIMDTFKNFIPLQVKVLRDGAIRNMLAAKLVPGDVVIIKEGDRIPADLRVIQSAEMRVDNSSLTGESDPLIRSVECTDQDNPLETKNICFFGTLCKQGTGKGVVINIGEHTVLGQIADLASSTSTGPTTFQKAVDLLILFIAILAAVMGIFFFGIGFPLGYNLVTNFLFAIGLLVGNAPTGLLITLTVSLTLCAKALSKKFVLVKNLQTMETLGSTSTICSDKTGTLTQNKMTVENLWYDGKIVKGVSLEKAQKGNDRADNLQIEYDYNAPSFKALQSAAVLSSEAVFELNIPGEKKKVEPIPLLPRKKQSSLWMNKKVVGDASETALVTFFQPIEDIEVTRSRNPLVKIDGNECRIPFNSTNKFAISIVHEDKKVASSQYALMMKGAPERIWKLCTKILIEGSEQPITEEWKQKFENANKFFAKNGQRVLGFAKLSLSSSKYRKREKEGELVKEFPFNATSVTATPPDYKEWNFPVQGLTFVGLISLIDPPRDAVPYSILKCKSAGIKVIMVTGDQPITAQAIAKQVNILDSNVKTNLDLEEEFGLTPEEAIMKADAVVIHGDLITKATSEESLLPLNEKGRMIQYWLSKRQIVFARTSPSQKLIIVSACQARGDIVAVTGDGVNDSPAIKKADVGIAMGITGSDVAKDAADLVLMTDDFSALVVGIEEGRKLYDNLKKAISYSLTTNIPEVVPYVLIIILGLPIPITTILMLFLCNGTDLCPAISLAYEDSELDIMSRKPRARHEHLVSRKMVTFCYAQIGMIESFGCFLTYFTVFADFGFPIESVLFLGNRTGFAHNSGDVYNPYDQYFGNSAIGGACSNTDQLASGAISNYSPDWYLNADRYTDLRMVYVACAYDNHGMMTGSLTSTIDYWPCKFQQISPVSGRPACYSTETGKYAQTSFFISVVLCQVANIIIHKTRRESIFNHGMKNFFQFWGIAFEIIICLGLAYIPALNTGLNSRDVGFVHFGTPALLFALLILFYNEVRVYLIKESTSNKKEGEKPGWWWRNYNW